MNKILIMLSTYNGEKYISKQLDSLYAQKDVDIHILVRDDGSNDRTIDILNSYISKYGKMTILAENNAGAALSFFALMKYAYENCERYDYYAFCDQDDVWLPFKLSAGADYLNSSNDKYKLYFSATTIVDNTLNQIGTFIQPKTFNYKTVLYRNPALGCTMVFNHKILERSLIIYDYINSDSFDKRYLPLHDAWMFACACYLDAYIYYDSKESMLYRQHDNNVTTYNKGLCKKIMLAYKRIKSKPNRHSCFAKLLMLLNVDVEKNKFLLLCKNYSRSFMDTCRLIKEFDFGYTSTIEKTLWICCILLRKF